MTRSMKGGVNSDSLSSQGVSQGNLQGSFGNMIQIMTFISPYSLIFFFVVLSIFTSSVKGFVYLVGVMFLYSVLSSFQPYASSSNYAKQVGKLCNFFGASTIFDIPNFSIALYCFTLFYLALPTWGKSIQNL